MLIDANIFLEVILEQQKARQCALFLREIQLNKTNGFVSSFTIDAIVFAILRASNSWRKAEVFLKSLHHYHGLQIYVPTLRDRIACLQFMDIYGLDYDDALTLQSALSAGCKKIMSLDADFDNIAEIKRVEP